MPTKTNIPMRQIDLDANPDIAELTGVLRRASSVTEPSELLASFGRWVSRRFNRDYFVSVSRRGLGDGQYKITRVLPGDPATPGYQPTPTHNPWRDWDTLPTHTGGLIGEIISCGTPQYITDLDLASDPVIGPIMGADAARMKWLSAMPTFDLGRSLNWAISFSADDEWLSLESFVNGLLDINMMGTATRNLVALREVERLHDQLDAQLVQIARVQESLLPKRTPHIDGYDFATCYLTCDKSGGDYYDFLDLPGGKTGILIADVAGHGPAAATVMAMLRAILHCYDGPSSEPADIMRFCNERLSHAGLVGSFTTAFFCVLDPVSGSLRYARCGHNPPRLRRASGRVEPIDEPGSLPLGVTPDAPIDQGETTIKPGDALVLYTDGITEAFAAGSRTGMFGVDRLDAALHSCSGLPGCAIDTILAALFEHTHSMNREDDQTLVVLQRCKGDGDG